MTNPTYFDRYENLAFSCDGNGVLTMRFHTKGGPIIFTGQTHEDLPFALEDFAADEDNRAMILTGTDDVFMDQIDGPSLGDMTKPVQFERTRSQGIKILERFPSLPFPVVGVANGPATVHSEYLLLTDIHIASERATYGDLPHPTFRDRGWRRSPGCLGRGRRYGADQVAALERREHRRCYRHGVGCCRGGPAS